MQDPMQDQPAHVKQAWEDLLREEAEERHKLTTAQAAVADAQQNIDKIVSFKPVFLSYYGGTKLEPDHAEMTMKPGGPCPLSDDQLRAAAEQGGYQTALVAIASETPGAYLHARTAAQWLMSGEVLTSGIDASRTKIAKHLQKSSIWERLGQGWYRLLEPAAVSEKTGDETGTEIGL